jgi:hypothetical protein
VEAENADLEHRSSYNLSAGSGNLTKCPPRWGGARRSSKEIRIEWLRHHPVKRRLERKVNLRGLPLFSMRRCQVSLPQLAKNCEESGRLAPSIQGGLDELFSAKRLLIRHVATAQRNLVCFRCVA